MKMESGRKRTILLTNESFIVQNPPEIAPRWDYTALPLLAAPPAVGQKKLLELTENYTPEVSDYKLTERWDSLLEPRLIVENVG